MTEYVLLENNDPTIVEYKINNEACLNSPKDSCDRSDTFDCSAHIPGAIFDWCSAPQGFEGPLLIERMIHFDYAFFPVIGNCPKRGNNGTGMDDDDDDDSSGGFLPFRRPYCGLQFLGSVVLAVLVAAL